MFLQDMHRSQNSATDWCGHQNHNHGTDFPNEETSVCYSHFKMTKEEQNEIKYPLKTAIIYEEN